MRFPVGVIVGSASLRPSHYFIPDRLPGCKYDGVGQIFARHLWGSTRSAYGIIADKRISELVGNIAQYPPGNYSGLQETRAMTLYLFKSKDVAADVFDGDLILMNLESRDVLVLNEADSVLWTGIDTLNTRDALLDLLREAMPGIKSSELEASLYQF